MNYVPSHLIVKSKKEPKEFTTLIENDTKVKTNSPYDPIDSLSAMPCTKALSFSTPTTIQKYVIPALLHSHPVLCRAPTGMGKTLCYLLPIVDNIRYNHRGIQLCVISPTRELCDQIREEALKISKTKRLRVESVYGSKHSLSSYADVDIIVAAPGRLLDLLNQKRIVFESLDYFILDEADKLLEMGFEKEIRAIKAFIRQETIVSLFSATYPVNLTPIINDFLPNNRVVVEVENETVSNINQKLFNLNGREKDEKLKEVLATMNFTENWKKKLVPDRVLIFTERKVSTIEIERKVTAMGYSCISIHGDKEQIDRTAALTKFRSGSIPIMIATSVAARGIDIKDIKLVINYDFPKDIKEYIHRIGRTGREGKQGVAMSFIEPDSLSYELKNDLIHVLQESGNEVPKFLTQKSNQRSSGSKVDRRKPGAYGRQSTSESGSSHHFDNKFAHSYSKQEPKLEKELEKLSVKKDSSLSEKQDSDDDVPCDW